MGEHRINYILLDSSSSIKMFSDMRDIMGVVEASRETGTPLARPSKKVIFLLLSL